MSQTNYVVTAGPKGVTLLLADVGGFRMTAEAAVYLAQQLLDAAHVAQPGCAGFMIPAAAHRDAEEATS